MSFDNELSVLVRSVADADFTSVTWIKSIRDSMVNSSERSSVDAGLGRAVGCKTCSSIHAIPEKKQNLS